MTQQEIIEALKPLIINNLYIEDTLPEDIDEDAPLFGEGLGLDSIDAVELVVLVEKNFGVPIDNAELAKDVFASLRTLAAYIEAHR